MWQKLSQDYDVRHLQVEDKELILDLYQTNPLYFHYFPPKPTSKSVEADLQRFPPSKRLEDKVFLGFFEGDTLIAVLDLVKDYPQSGIGFMGLFMVHGAYQGQGLGSLLLSEVFEGLSLIYHTVRLCFVEANPQASRFWKKQGFLLTGESIKKGDQVIVFAEKTLRDE